MRSLIVTSFVVIASALLSACGDTVDSRISDADAAYLKYSRYADAYGTGTTTVTATVTSTSTTTATQTDYSVVTVTASTVTY